MNAAQQGSGSPKIWNPRSRKPLYFYSESLNMNFPVSRLDWADWYQALSAASPNLDDEQLLTALLKNASKETRFPENPLYDMPWYERENYLAESVITAGWDPPVRQQNDDLPDQQPAEEDRQSHTEPAGVAEMDREEWGSWYANVSTKNPQLDDLCLLAELIHAAGADEPKKTKTGHRYLARIIMSAGWKPPTRRQ